MEVLGNWYGLFYLRFVFGPKGLLQTERVCIGGNFSCYFYLFIYLFRFLAPSVYDNIIHEKQKDFKQNFELLAFIYCSFLIFFLAIYILYCSSIYYINTICSF